MKRCGFANIRAVLYIGVCLWIAVVVMICCAPGTEAALAEQEFHVAVADHGDAADETQSAAAFRVEVIREEQMTSSIHGKKVLIYHTHTYEAYEQVDESTYKQTERWRTADHSHNVVAVGKALAASLTALGFEVVHDTTAFEPPTLDDAYERSLTMLERRLKNGEQYDLYIDLHRDAISSTSTIKRTVNIGGESIARFMVLVGKGTTGGYEETPDWERNLQLAQWITDALNAQYDGLAREVKVKTGRFNQHIDDCCVLIECGMNTNLLSEVLAGVPYLAQAIADALEHDDVP